MSGSIYYTGISIFWCFFLKLRIQSFCTKNSFFQDFCKLLFVALFINSELPSLLIVADDLAWGIRVIDYPRNTAFAWWYLPYTHAKYPHVHHAFSNKTLQNVFKTFETPFKQLFDQPTDRPTERPTERALPTILSWPFLESLEFLEFLESYIWRNHNYVQEKCS